MTTEIQIKQELIEAVFQGKLAETSRAILARSPDDMDNTGRALAQSALATCRLIGEYCAAQQQAMIRLLREAGVDAKAEESPEQALAQQFHRFSLNVTEQDLELALQVSAQEGYLHWPPLNGGAWRSFRRLNSSMGLTKTDSVTTRMSLRWRDKVPANRVAKLLRPTIADYQLLDLPRSMWPLYHALRPLRLAANVLRGRRGSNLGIFLGTPMALIPQLLDFSQATEDDVILDLGCGDGRILIEAARLRGCRAIGVENNARLVELAQSGIDSNSVADRVEVVHGDALHAPLQRASIVFLFLPVGQIRTLLPAIRSKLSAGSRIVMHEQMPIDINLAPDRSDLLLAESALTVAHLWQVS